MFATLVGTSYQARNDPSAAHLLAKDMDDSEYARDLVLREHGLSPLANRLGSAASSEACPICLESIQPDYQVVLGDCNHMCCAECTAEFLRIAAVELKQYPVRCPTCSGPLNTQRCLSFLIGTDASFEALQSLALIKEHMSNVLYCSNETCSAPFEWLEPPSSSSDAGDDIYRVACPLCGSSTCVRCKTSWHVGKSCARFKREREDENALVAMAHENKWQSCPRCGELIERWLGDCAFVVCRCGCGFCHECGKAYKKLTATATNSHGTADCSCGLFTENYVPWKGPVNAETLQEKTEEKIRKAPSRRLVGALKETRRRIREKKDRMKQRYREIRERKPLQQVEEVDEDRLQPVVQDLNEEDEVNPEVQQGDRIENGQVAMDARKTRAVGFPCREELYAFWSELKPWFTSVRVKQQVVVHTIFSVAYLLARVAKSLWLQKPLNFWTGLNVVKPWLWLSVVYAGYAVFSETIRFVSRPKHATR